MRDLAELAEVPHASTAAERGDAEASLVSTGVDAPAVSTRPTPVAQHRVPALTPAVAVAFAAWVAAQVHDGAIGSLHDIATALERLCAAGVAVPGLAITCELDDTGCARLRSETVSLCLERMLAKGLLLRCVAPLRFGPRGLAQMAAFVQGRLADPRTAPAARRALGALGCSATTIDAWSLPGVPVRRAAARSMAR